jgi:hypothetical protein
MKINNTITITGEIKSNDRGTHDSSKLADALRERDEAREHWGNESMNAAQFFGEKTKAIAERDEWRITASSLKAGESELLKENAKLRDIAERLSICAEDLEKYTWHCNDQGCDCGRCKLAIEQKELRSELEQLKEGAK